MKIRAIKRRRSRGFHQHWPLLAAEDLQWLRMPPIGRKFGSPDLDHLMALDARERVSRVSEGFMADRAALPVQERDRLEDM